MPPRDVVRSRPKAKVTTVSVRGEKRVEDEYYERVLQNGHKWGFPEPTTTPYTPPPPAKPEPPEAPVPWWKNLCDPRWLISVRCPPRTCLPKCGAVALAAPAMLARHALPGTRASALCVLLRRSTRPCYAAVLPGVLLALRVGIHRRLA